MSDRDRVKIFLESERLDAPYLKLLVRTPAAGAIVTFEGTVRDHHDGRKVIAIEYEAYDAMALGQLRSIAQEALDYWQLAGVAIAHRIGPIPIGETAVVIAVSSVHRREAFEACSHIIDRLKDVVPIWKKETTEEGSGWIGESTLFRDS
jgi:molybdopterin synthase catalytic subunit